MHDDAYISGRSENNIKCVVHDDLGWKNRTTLYILPRHWLHEWFSQFHRCGTYSFLSQSPSTVEIGQRVRPCGATHCQKWKFSTFGGLCFQPMHQLAWNFVWASGPMCPSAVLSFTWICATSHSCGLLIFGLWVNLIPAVCHFAANAAGYKTTCEAAPHPH